MSLFDDIAVFVRAVEAESFSGAAQRLGVAKSVVSRRMASLEGRLGTSLFHRTTRRLSLTETGHAYYERARRILADVAEAEDVARRLQSERLAELGSRIPVIVITAFPDDRIRERALSAGAVGFLNKPFNTEGLLTCIRSALDRRHGDGTHSSGKA